MKHFYLLCGMIALIDVGAMARETGLSASRATFIHVNPDGNIPREDRSVLGVSGRVTDENGAPFPGVNIVVKGTTTGTATDADGKYSIEADDNSTIVFSFVGYRVQEVAVGGRTVIDITMNPDVLSLNEVVVTALGIKKESKKLGYATATVATEQIQQNRTTNFMESLEGKVAGLDISPPAAGSGASTKIRLRGQAAFSGANNSPLIVVNGLPMDQGAQGADGSATLADTRDRGDGLQNINPDDIESMTVLKGATAAALYGSRAANGAIVITTKSGQKGNSIGVEYTSNYTVNTVLDYTDLQQEYGQGTWNPTLGTGVRPATQGEAVSSGQLGWGAKLDGEPTVNFDGISRPYSANPNRIKEFYRNGSSFTNTVALSGGNANGSFRASFSNVKTKGITPNNAYDKKIGNIGLNYDITEKLKFSLNANYGHEENDNPPQVGVQGSGEANFIYRMATSIPLSAFQESVLNPSNGITERQTSGFQQTLINPYFSMPRMFFRNDKDRLLATASLRYQFTKWLYLQGRYNYDYSASLTEFNTPTGLGTNNPLNGSSTNPGYNGTYDLRTSQGTEINADFLLGANHEFGDFSIDASVGGNTYRTNYRYTTQSVNDFVTLGIYSLANGLSQDENTFSIDRRRVNSLYAMAEFGYKDMVYLNVTDRQDWFSVLNPKNNSQNYPSVSGSFIFSELINQNWLSYGKLRGSWAQVGSANGIGFGEGMLTYSIATNNYPNGTTNGQKLGSISVDNAPNPNLQPFVVTEKEIGMELKLFNRKLSLDVAAYDKVTEGQILTVAISNASGYTGTKQNLGSLQNRGLEFLVEVVPVERDNFRWVSSVNAAYNTTKVLALSPGTTRFTQTTFSGNEFIGQLVYEVGLPLNQLSAKTYKRDANGNILLNSNGTLIASDNFVNFGSALPTWTGGWNNTFSYKKLSLFVQFDFKAGGKILSSSNLNWLRQGLSKASLVGREGGVVFDGIVESTGEPYSGPGVNPQTFYTDYRTKQIADPVVYNNDFVKLRNITLTYDLSSVVKNSKFIKGLVISAACRNVAILYKDLPNLDPEAFASSGDNRVGYEGITQPTTRNYSFNLNVRF